MTRTITFLLFLFMFLLVLYLNKPESGHEQQLRKLDEKYSNRIDSIRSHYNDILKDDSIIVAQYGTIKQQAIELEIEANKYKLLYEHEKNNHRHFSDITTDSLLSIIR